MTNKIYIIIVLICFPFILYGQTFNKKYFTKTEWFSNNLDSMYSRSDTIKLIKYSNMVCPPWSEKAENSEYEMKYLKHGDFVVITLLKHGKMNYYERYNNYMSVVTIDKWTWKFDNKSNSLRFYKNDKLTNSFQPLAERKIEIEAKFANQKEHLITKELTVLRNK